MSIRSIELPNINFNIFQDRETLELELYLTKVGADRKAVFSADA